MQRTDYTLPIMPFAMSHVAAYLCFDLFNYAAGKENLKNVLELNIQSYIRIMTKELRAHVDRPQDSHTPCNCHTCMIVIVNVLPYYCSYVYK